LWNWKWISGSNASPLHRQSEIGSRQIARDLADFTLGYLGQTGQNTSRQLASSTLATNWSYLNNTGDRLVAGHFSNFTFTSTREDFVASVTETSDASAVYPAALTQTGTFNNLNQLTNLSGQTLTWDTVGNLTADGTRTYTWDAENRLVGIGYPAQPGKATAFTYDGLGRRVSITETPPGGGTPVTTRYLWCGDAICQARDGGNVPTRSYYDEGEFVPGAPGQPHFYGVDQLGSVRRAFASASSAPAFNYDPYGSLLTGPAPTTDFGFAGLFNHQPSGLNLTLYRAYDPVAGRWLSRDPIGEDSVGNLYPYASLNPVNLTDPLGLFPSLLPNTLPAEDFCLPGFEQAAGPRPGGGPRGPGGAAKGEPKSPKTFVPPTNSPRPPPSSADLPPGHTVRVGPPTKEYPNGYWRQYNERGQPVDPSTGKPPSNVTKPEFESRTHTPIPPI
jgi:RHS repeat-associated protein